ncbi:uncharacterized protein GGS22DRAFT_196596 [Annulohypoxylon maeteangense]|uniref:uncharacterized protein n=1 Tax=Annulohypoxylon maeteangense TaxID=1927788 RepID=UPI0020079614|nr:uncharacterized protein GGS22DRAFT_196596 [Annulohypoxylon maeteangense]KAI0888715.1 hypothetical protein GGS22DRAFT_196596 [Annulohypoxylon maeteangense]
MNGARRGYPDVPNNGPQTNNIIWAFTAVATAFLGLRMICKYRRHSHIWSDDWFLVASWVLLVISCILVSISITDGFGKHDRDINPEVLSDLGLRSVVVGSLYTISSAWSKTSFAISLLRLATSRMRILIWSIIVSMNVFLHMSAVLTWASCRPIEKLWKHTPEGECWPPEIIMPTGIFFNGTSSHFMRVGASCPLANSNIRKTRFLSAVLAYSGFADLVLVLLSWSIVMKLRIDFKEKIGVGIAMSMGLFAGGAAIFKTIELTAIDERDFNYQGSKLIVRNVAEIATTIIAASIPVLRTLVCNLAWNRGNGAATGRRYFRSVLRRDNRTANVEAGMIRMETMSGSAGVSSATSGSRKLGSRGESGRIT